MAYRLKNIDALRGFAALLVVWQHFSEQFVKFSSQGAGLANIITDYDFGRIGIVCFFLISGFVIPQSFDNQHPKPLKKFATRRFFRLYPTYWLSLILMSLVYYLWFQAPETSTFLFNITMLQSFFNAPHIIGLYWTLQIELVFYMACALLFHLKILNSEKHLISFSVILMAIFALLQINIRFSNSPLSLSNEFQLMPLMLAIMFLGAVFRKAYESKNTNSNSNHKTAFHLCLLGTIACFGPALLLWILSIFDIELFAGQFRFGAGHVLGLVLFLGGLVIFKNAGRIWLSLGAISYSIYLFHPVILKAMQHWVPQLSSLQGYPLLVYLIFGSTITIALSVLVYQFLEKPMIRLGYKLSR